MRASMRFLGERQNIALSMLHAQNGNDWASSSSSASPLLGCALWRCVGRQGDRRVACLLQWSLAECWIPEVANGNGDLPGKAIVLPEDGRAACRTGVKVRALPLSAARVHAAVLPAEELLEPKRAWLLMPPYGAGIIALALLCQSGGDVSLERAPLILRPRHSPRNGPHRKRTCFRRKDSRVGSVAKKSMTWPLGQHPRSHRPHLSTRHALPSRANR